MRANKYILDEDGNPVVEPDLMKWAKWFEGSDKSYKDGKPDSRFVARDKIGDAEVSTVFLGLDHNWGDGPPLLFETMIFGGKHEGWQDRYSTREDALEGHKRAMKMVEEEG